MRPLPAIFVAILVGFIATATVLMTNQFGVRAWPTAPAPQVATRVVAPSDEVALQRVTVKRGPEHAGGAANGREPAATRVGTPSAPALVRRGSTPRHLATPRPPQNQMADNSPLPTPATPAPAPAAPHPAPPADEPVSQARNDAPAPTVPDVAPPALAIPPQPEGDDGDDGEQGDDGRHGHDGGGDHGHGIVRHLLDQLP